MSWWMKINVPDNVSLFCHIWKMWDTHCCIRNIRFVDREFRFKEGHRSTKNDTFPLTSRYKKRGLIRLWTARSNSSERKRQKEMYKEYRREYWVREIGKEIFTWCSLTVHILIRDSFQFYWKTVSRKFFQCRDWSILLSLIKLWREIKRAKIIVVSQNKRYVSTISNEISSLPYNIGFDISKLTEDLL